MECLLELILVIMPIHCNSDSMENFFKQDQPPPFAQIEELINEGLFKKYFKYAQQKHKDENWEFAQKREDEKREFAQKLEDEQREFDILRFVCACALIRDINRREFKVAETVFRGCKCSDTWTRYIASSNNSVAVKLRGKSYETALLNQSEYSDCADALCSTYYVCSKHIGDDRKTVKVLSQLRKGTSKTIIEILEEERPKFLISVEEMRYVNIFVQATGENSFPFFTFVKCEDEFAIPKIRNSTDMRMCPATFYY